MATVYESKRKSKHKKKRRLLKITAAIAAIVVISAFAAVMITNGGKLSAEGFRNLISGVGKKAEAVEFSFDAGVGSVCTDLGGGLAVCSTIGIRVYDESAQPAYSETFELSYPTICLGGDTAAAYDLGGTALKVFDLTSVKYSLTTQGNIIAASLNRNDWLAVCTQESGGYKGRVTVYDENGNVRYYWNSAKGYVLSAEISPDNKNLAVVTLTDEGSRIVLFSLNSTDEKASAALTGEIILDFEYLDDGTLLAVGKNALYSMKKDGTCTAVNDYSDKYLQSYSINNAGYAVLVLNDYLVGNQGQTLTLDKNGSTLGSAAMERETLSVSSRGRHIAVLYSGSLVIYDRNLKELARYDDAAGAVQATIRSDNKVLLMTQHTASIRNLSGG